MYGLLKGLRTGKALDDIVQKLLQASRLTQYADRLALKLSGGNQRGFSFAVAMIGITLLAPLSDEHVLIYSSILLGNPSVIFIDEYSTGFDAATKRSMWVAFRRMATDKAVALTTRE